MVKYATDDDLRSFYERRHPAFYALEPHWRFLKQTYEGGRAWFDENIFKFHKEGRREFNDRRKRAYRFNHTRETVDLVQKYLFKADIARSPQAPQALQDFWARASRANLDIDALMRLASTANSVMGRSAIVVDNNLKPGAVTIAEAKAAGVRIYAYVVNAIDLLDYAYDEDGDGRLLWVKIREIFRDDKDPLTSDGCITERVRLWTRDGWILYEDQDVSPEGSKEPEMKVIQIDSGTHELGRVPVVFVDHNVGDHPYKVPGLIDDIAYLDKAVANYLSNLDAIIQDQTFSQLAMPAQGLLPGEESYDKVLELGTKRVFVYDGGAGNAAPEFISPDPKQAGVILTVINKIINEIYHSVGLAGERTKEDNSQGIDNSSGVAKAYDFDRVNSLLMSKAQACEIAENEIAELVCLWAGEKVPTEKLVKYPETFDVMMLSDELMVAESLGKIAAPIELRREQMRMIVDKMFPRLTSDLKQKIRKDIDSWLEGTDIVLNPPTGFTGPKSPVAPSRQGQVTKQTPAGGK
ncbi:hypothetical protein NKH72_22350 [Mesorhizobium sp. M0955]|uniref:hypothetical protein n=1 Tax=Mesorhizobium sp. M0955 TaxID=2957033 RepID=UPI003336C1EB